jgi:hypothetical protein
MRCRSLARQLRAFLDIAIVFPILRRQDGSSDVSPLLVDKCLIAATLFLPIFKFAHAKKHLQELNNHSN